MKLTHSLCAAALFTLSGPLLHGADVLWGVPHDISSDTDISTNGLLVGAVNPTGSFSSTVLINGVPFAPMMLNGAGGRVSAAVGDFVLAGVGGNVSFQSVGAGQPLFTNLSQNYRTMVVTAAVNYPTDHAVPLALTMNGLTLGEMYEFQWWCSAAVIPDFETIATAGNTVTLHTNRRLDRQGDVGQFVIGTFVADSPSETIHFSGSGDSAFLNGFQLRNLGAPIPEPSSTALVMLGVALSRIGGTRRGKRRDK